MQVDLGQSKSSSSINSALRKISFMSRPDSSMFLRRILEGEGFGDEKCEEGSCFGEEF